MPLHLQTKISHTPTLKNLGSMPFLPTPIPHLPVVNPQLPHGHHSTLEQPNAAWNRQRGSLQAFNMHPNMVIIFYF